MTLGTQLHWLGVAVGGGAVVGLVRIPLRLEERAAIAVVTGVAGGSLASFLLSLGFGLNNTTVLLGPPLLGALAAAAAALTRGPGPLAPWRDSWAEAKMRARSGEFWTIMALTGVAAIAFALLLGHAFFERDGAIVAGYSTVWADWSLHSTIASSFVQGHNLPPSDPIFSGTPLRYPFLPDFHSAMLETVGTGVAAALAAPDAVLCVCVVVLIVSLAKRLTGSVAVGAVAATICFAGGGLGFSGLWWDACAGSGESASSCAPLQVARHPDVALSVLRHVPGTVSHQPRNYDNLQTDEKLSPVGNVQWYTPLLAWWLPQRTFVYGFAVGMAVLLLVVAGLRSPPVALSPFLIAGLLAGTLPLIHLHTLIVLAIVLPLMALRARRREWLGLVGTTALLAGPRLAQVAAAGHGVDSGPFCGNVFPYLEPGWKWNTAQSVGCQLPGRFEADALGLVRASPHVVATFFSPGFWGFWVINTGLVVVTALLVTVAVGLRIGLRRWARVAHRGRGEGDRGRLSADAPEPAAAAPAAQRLDAALGRVFPAELLRFCLPFMAVFAIANVVVFQSWDWDNTKMLAWWYFAGALLVGAWVVHWWRSTPVRGLLATLGVLTVVASGGLTLYRYLGPGAEDDVGVPYTWANDAERALARDVETATPRGAVLLTGGNPIDPLLTLAGRRAVMGYAGWLNSYGTDFGTRISDVTTIYRGCAGEPPQECPIGALLQRYRVDFVELGPYELQNQAANQAWWDTNYPVLVRGAGITVYDVRRP